MTQTQKTPNAISFVVYGEAARRELSPALTALRKVSTLPVAVITDAKTAHKDVDHVLFDRRDRGARWSKLNLDTLSQFENTLYMDVDTRVKGDIFAGFNILADGWDFVVTASHYQAGAVFRHINNESEKTITLNELANGEPLQLQGGVFFFAKNERTYKLFQAWREEWERFEDQDQAALLRALDRAPVRVWLLSQMFNGGELVEHLFGRAVEA